MRWRSPVLPFIAALLSGVLLALCLPPWDRSSLLWLWQLPLFAALWFWEPDPSWQTVWPFRHPRWLWAGLTGWIAGTAYFLMSLFWLRHVTWPGMILLCFYLALYFAAWSAFAATLGRLRLSALAPLEPEPTIANPHEFKFKNFPTKPEKFRMMGPSLHTLRVAFLCSAAWVTSEWLRGLVFTGFGWNGLGVALYDSPNLRQAADLVGVTGLSFVPVFVSAVMVATVARFILEFGQGKVRPHLDFSLAMVLLIATFLYGVHLRRPRPAEKPSELSGVIVQGNISIEQRYNLDPAKPASAIYDIYEKLTSLYTRQHYDLILWPETCLPTTFFEVDTQRYLNNVLALGDFHLLTGIDQVILKENGGMDVFNSMVVMKGTTESYQAYHKTHLVPFGEFIPFRNSFPIFTWALGRLIPEDFDAGKDYTLLKLKNPDIEIIPTICFEDTIGRVTRRFLSKPPDGPQVIVNVTNDSWFNRSPANRQHLANAIFRAVELKRPMIRCANTGISCVIDEFGSLDDPAFKDPAKKRIFADRKTGSPFVKGCFPFRLRAYSQPPTTVYARFGDWFSILMLVITAGSLALPTAYRVVRRKLRPSTPSKERLSNPAP